MTLVSKIRSMEIRYKIFILLIVIISVFAIISSLVSPLFTYEEIMQQGMHTVKNKETNYLSVNFVSILLSLALGLLLFDFMQVWGYNIKYTMNNSREDYSVVLQSLKMGFNKDEKELFEEIEKSEEITQDSLRLRLGWSKSKVSTIASYLDRQGLIQRKRSGKTYILLLDKRFSKNGNGSERFWSHGLNNS